MEEGASNDLLANPGSGATSSFSSIRMSLTSCGRKSLVNQDIIPLSTTLECRKVLLSDNAIQQRWQVFWNFEKDA